jgi:hypothetical protein
MLRLLNILFTIKYIFILQQGCSSRVVVSTRREEENLPQIIKITEVLAACGYCKKDFDLCVLDLLENSWYNQNHSVAKLIDCFINSSVCLLFSRFGKKKSQNLAKHVTASGVTSVPIRWSNITSDSRHTPHLRMANTLVTCKSDDTSSTFVSESSKSTAQDIFLPRLRVNDWVSQLFL